MSKIRGNAEGLAAWSRRDPWRERMRSVIEEHLGKACEANDLAVADLAEVIGSPVTTVLECAFEDGCTRVWEDGGNLADDYLKRRGWKDTAINRAYIAALRDSVTSLYEVGDVRQGESFLARDLVRGGEPVRVNERTATRTLVAGDVIAARVVTVRGEVRLTNAVLAVDRDLAEEILALLDRARRRAPGMMAGLVESIDPDLRARLESAVLDDDEMLRVAAPKITTLWLNAAIRRQLAPPP